MVEATITLPMFGKAVVPLDVGAEMTPAEARALERFLSLGRGQKTGATRHVHACYQDLRAEIGAETLDGDMPPPATPDDIWRHVTVTALRLVPDRDDAERVFVSLSANCGWDPEHGLQMVWQDGETLVRVSGEDGHVTNARAYGDPRLERVVYHASNSEFETLRDD